MASHATTPRLLPLRVSGAGVAGDRNVALTMRGSYDGTVLRPAPTRDGSGAGQGAGQVVCPAVVIEHTFVYGRAMIRIRGVPVSDEDAHRLVRLLAHDEAAAGFVDRLERALIDGDGLIATDRLEARAALFAVQRLLAACEHSERLLELRASLVEKLRS